MADVVDSPRGADLAAPTACSRPSRQSLPGGSLPPPASAWPTSGRGCGHGGGGRAIGRGLVLAEEQPNGVFGSRGVRSQIDPGPTGIPHHVGQLDPNSTQIDPPIHPRRWTLDRRSVGSRPAASRAPGRPQRRPSSAGVDQPWAWVGRIRVRVDQHCLCFVKSVWAQPKRVGISQIWNALSRPIAGPA